MAVTLDAPHAVQPGGDTGPMWLVRCDGECHHRLYLHAPDAGIAAKRAEVEHGWRIDGGIWCREHSRG